MAWNENLGVFFSGLDRTSALFTVDDETTLEVTGYFDRAWYDASVGETVLDATSPRFTCELAPIHEVRREMAVTIDGEAFSVIEVQPEGTGLATIKLAVE